MRRDGAGVLVDSHLWIELLSGKQSKAVAEVARLIRSGDVVIAGPVLYEVLVGPRSEGHRQYLQGRLRAFRLLEAGERVWLKAVELGRLPGVAARQVPFSDVLLAAHAEIYSSALFTQDPHFDAFPRLKRHNF